MSDNNPSIDEWRTTVEDGKLVINDSIEILAFLEPPVNSDTMESEELRIRHPGDGNVDGFPCGTYAHEGRPDDREAVAIELRTFDPESEEDE